MSTVEVLTDILADSDFAEDASFVVRADRTETAVDCVVTILRDEQNYIVGSGDTRNDKRATIKVLATVHADFGGVIQPQIGDVWTIAEVKGGTASSGWVVEKMTGHSGWWELNVIQRERQTVGAKRIER